MTSNIARLTPTAPSGSLTPTQLNLIKRTVAPDTNDDEFSQFIWTATYLRLDPLRRQIYAFVFSKDNPKKRRMSIITGIDGFRTIADRTGCYRPDEDEPSFEIDADAKSALNPAGLVKATVRVYKFSHGGWHKVTASAYWDEYAPIKDEWGDDPDTGRRKPTGKQTLDTTGNWGKMPRLMLAKVAEALALRKAWPDDLAAVYAAEEVDRARTFEDMTPAEMAARGAAEERLERISSMNSVMFQFEPNGALEPIGLGKIADRIMAFVRDNAEEPSTVALFAERNRHSLREFWAHAPSDALEVKKAIEGVTAKMREDAQ